LLQFGQTPDSNKFFSSTLNPWGKVIWGIKISSTQVVWPQTLHLKCTWSWWWWWRCAHALGHKAYFGVPSSSNTLWIIPFSKKVLSVRYKVTRSNWCLNACSKSIWAMANFLDRKNATTSNLQVVCRSLNWSNNSCCLFGFKVFDV